MKHFAIKTASAVLTGAMLLSLSACKPASSEQPASLEQTASAKASASEAARTEESAELFSGMEIKKISVFRLRDLGSRRVEGGRLILETPAEPVFETEDPAELARLMGFFDGWDVEAHKGESLDSIATAYICFDDQLLIEYCDRADTLGYTYYGRIYSEKLKASYDLPAGFCEFVEAQLAN